METETISPKIISFAWGKIETPDNVYRDAKLYPGGARAWDWNETGTHHSPGIQAADAQELLNHNADIIILSKGINERLQTAPDTEKLLQQAGCEYLILQSQKAVDKYNQLRNSRAVGALIHSTC